MAKHFNITSMLLFVQSLPNVVHSLPPGMPLEMKIGIFFATTVALVLSSYISRRSYLQNKVALLEKTVAELYTAVAKLESIRDTMTENMLDMEMIMGNCDKKSEFMFTNMSYLQKALHKKLDFEERYKNGKKEAYLNKNRQQAIQEYLNAERIVAQRFNEG